MSTLATKALGKVEINPDEIIEFPEGLFGFHEFRRFALLAESSESVFKWLQSAEEPGLAFVVIEPELFLRTPYKPDPAPGELEALEVQRAADCMIYVIVTIPENNPQKMTANLQGPILINIEKKLGRQVISHQEGHRVRVSILEQLEG